MLKRLSRPLCFILTAFLAAGIVHSFPWWFITILGGCIGVLADIGWEDEKDKS